jgi:hypothetical protein
MCQHFPFRGPPKFTQIGIFGLKICHLVPLVQVTSVVVYFYIYEHTVKVNVCVI